MICTKVCCSNYLIECATSMYSQQTGAHCMGQLSVTVKYHRSTCISKMSNRSPNDILADLDKELAGVKWCGPPSDLSHLHDPGHLSLFKQFRNFEANGLPKEISACSKTRTRRVSDLYSIGCEGASLDSVILQKLSKALPDKMFKYTGISLLMSKHVKLPRKR